MVDAMLFIDRAGSHGRCCIANARAWLEVGSVGYLARREVA